MIKPFEHNKGDRYREEFKQKYIPEDQLVRPSLLQKKDNEIKTRSTIDRIVSQKSQITQKSTANQIKTETDSKYLKYKPKHSKKQRIVRIQEIQEDPFCPPQYKNKRIPHGPKGTPDILLRDPPRKVTQSDQTAWKIPPCISNTKNSRGFVLPLEMRISADGKNRQEHKLNEKFLHFSSAIYESEKQGRKALEERKRIQQTLAHEEQIKREESIKREIEEAENKKNSFFTKNKDREGDSDSDSDEEGREAEKQRKLMQQMIKKNAEREVRLKNVGNNRLKEVRDHERDIAEKIALGQKIAKQDDIEIDDRAAVLTGGLDSGYKGEDAYDLYDKPLFQDKIKTNLYTGAKDFEDEHFNVDLKKRNTLGAGKTSHKEKVLKRKKPIEFEKYSGGQ